MPAPNENKIIVYTHAEAIKQIKTCLFCNIKQFWTYLATGHDKAQL